MKIAVFGLGYSGLATAFRLCELGHEVYGYDISESRVVQLNKGSTGMSEPSFDEMLNRYSGNQLKFVWYRTPSLNTMRDIEKVNFDLAFICVSTNSSSSGRLDRTGVMESLLFLRLHLSHFCQVVIRSTMDLELWNATKAMNSTVSSNLFVLPEFFQEGKAMEEARNPSRLVLGVGETQASAETMGVINQLGGGAPLLTMSAQSAILAKLASNTFLAQRVALIDSIAEVAELSSANIDDISKAVGLDPRIGPNYLHSGLGYGGGCLPKDVLALEYAGVELASAINSSNNSHQHHIKTEIRRMMEGNAKTITVWGVSFKEGTSDLRGSASLEVLDYLFDRSLLSRQIKIYQPNLKTKDALLDDFPDAQVCDSMFESLEGSELLIVMTREPEFQAFDFNQAVLAMKKHQIYDAVRILPARQILDLGFKYTASGVAHDQLKFL